jgi:hypothetical protein
LESFFGGFRVLWFRELEHRESAGSRCRRPGTEDVDDLRIGGVGRSGTEAPKAGESWGFGSLADGEVGLRAGRVGSFGVEVLLTRGSRRRTAGLDVLWVFGSEVPKVLGGEIFGSRVSMLGARGIDVSRVRGAEGLAQARGT